MAICYYNIIPEAQGGQLISEIDPSLLSLA